MGLEDYQRKRDFDATPEPAGTERTSDPTRLAFVVQRHAARRLHYDFRLELDGVLVSWAVPKGPSLDPAARRQAIRTEDHPVAYGDFEGVIPKGQYGGGSVLLWDRGTWLPDGDARAGLAKGHLRFTLAGERLRGGWTLVHTDGASWLLIKRKDDLAVAGDADGVTARAFTSVATGRTQEQVAEEHQRTWTRAGELPSRDQVLGLAGAKAGPLPWPLAAQLPERAQAPPSGPGWQHELALGGVRALARVAGGRPSLATSAGRDWTGSVRGVAAALAALPIDVVLDGEVAWLGADGRGDPAALQRALGRDDPNVYYLATDLLQLGDVDLRGVALASRRALLGRLIPPTGRVRVVGHVDGVGDLVHAHACALGVPAVVSKRADAPWAPGRGHAWVVAPCVAEEGVPGPVVAPSPPPHAVRTTNPQRVLYPDEGLTKADVAAYYTRMADLVLAQVARRPLTLLRCPGGLATCFHQKHLHHLPKAVRPVDVGLDHTYLWVDDADGLLGLVQHGALELHPWGSRVDDLERPDRLIFDLDPDEDLPPELTVAAAREVRAFLEELGLTSFVKRTGGKGLHVVVPVRPRAGWDDARAFCRGVAEELVRRDPGRYTATLSKDRRTHRVFVDWLRNQRDTTAVAAWSTRARPGARVAAPLTWPELDAAALAEAPRLDRAERPAHDPFGALDDVDQALTPDLLGRWAARDWRTFRAPSTR